MISVVSFPFVDSKSGEVTFTPPSSYVAATGYASCRTGQNTITGSNWRAYFNFDTSSIPDHAQVTKVEFLIRMNTFQLEGMPDIYRLKFSIGTFIGAALDGNATEFNAGTLMVTLTGSKPTDNTWLDLDQQGGGPEPYVNRAGDTDMKVWDDSVQGGGDPSWSTDFNTSKAKCRLRVTYQVPTATATGRGTASAAASVMASGSAIATGNGTGQAAGSVMTTGSGAGTGRGEARLVAVVLVAGTGSATGEGTAEASATVAAAGSGTASGQGLADLVAVVITVGSASVVGRGLAELDAVVIVAASGGATGRGSAFCQGIAENLSASATATGRGFASCRLVAVYFEPVARHAGTRAVRSAHAAARAVSWVHERTCAAGRMN